jgi:hypothetical protein
VRRLATPTLAVAAPGSVPGRVMGVYATIPNHAPVAQLVERVALSGCVEAHAEQAARSSDLRFWHALKRMPSKWREGGMDADWKLHQGWFTQQFRLDAPPWMVHATIPNHAPVAQLVERVALSACVEAHAEQTVRRRHGSRLDASPWTVHATIPNHAPVAQLDRVPPSEGGGRTFESSRARHFPFVSPSHRIAITGHAVIDGHSRRIRRRQSELPGTRNALPRRATPPCVAIYRDTPRPSRTPYSLGNAGRLFVATTR